MRSEKIRKAEKAVFCRSAIQLDQVGRRENGISILIGDSRLMTRIDELHLVLHSPVAAKESG